uniref:Histone-lysine N-methyltransferase SET5 n=1 Tax=Kwoniella dejecticola CBS 10117 TaxID=1296121 RepID=A0A1A6AEB5_9TREE|nr:uncharacterized protein I303_00234 [Kwoniella dejecticola CBS 10117]OBR88417.1 hypothetical protein I303_00234 [Kwoniella dejecticola CBS 10117]
MSGITVTPTDTELQEQATLLRESHPALGVGKLLAQLKIDHPDWSVSEKRFKKFVSVTSSAGSDATNVNVNANGNGNGDTIGLTSTSTSVSQSKSTGDDALIAKTGIDHSIDVSKIAPKVKVKMFNVDGKGKGLVAKEKLQMGELLWQEDPWIVTNDASLWPYLSSHEMCTQCLTLFPQPNPPLSVMCTYCREAHFCNRLCYSKASSSSSSSSGAGCSSSAHNDFLCPGQNPGCSALLSFIHQKKARDLDGVARIIASWKREREYGDEKLAKEIERRVWGSLARVRADDQSVSFVRPFISKDRMEEWRLTHLLILRALNPSPMDEGYKPFQKFLNSKRKSKTTQPLSNEEEERWFSFESFLELLGLIGLNQESSGGLYALHSHLNHSCEPNVQVRNLPKGWIAPTPSELPAELPPPMTAQTRGTNRISMIVKKTIHPGDELTISYVDQRLSRDERRTKLREQYGFWCACQRCIKEKKAEDAEAQTKAKATA